MSNRIALIIAMMQQPTVVKAHNPNGIGGSNPPALPDKVKYEIRAEQLNLSQFSAEYDAIMRRKAEIESEFKAGQVRMADLTKGACSETQALDLKAMSCVARPSPSPSPK